MQPRGGSQRGICNGVQKSLEIIDSTTQGHTCPECWQLWPIVGGAGNGAAEEDWCWDLNPGTAAIRRFFFGTTSLVETTRLWRLFREHSAWEVLSFCPVDGAGGLNHFFPEIWYPGLGKGEKKGLCAFVSILKNFSQYYFK